MIKDDLMGTIMCRLIVVAATLASSYSIAADEVVNVEIFNAGSAVILPGEDFKWGQNPDNRDHDFSIKPAENQELTYYLPESRAKREAFSYVQGNKRCLFSFGHVEQVPMDEWATMHYTRWVKAEPDQYCSASLIDVADDDPYVRNGGTRIKFIMN
ncbi:hypothetical protein [Pseudomonas sp. PDM32]|uniref:hypothetical protein n=1 Tax=Pseudomonas sp. PDM32 TaxID=2854768 RepID=UPI00210AB0DE|nr:hypothetical protein [Pseudomonas sp. PDM32]